MDISRWVFGSGAAMGFAVLIAATAVASFRTGFLPGWLVWVSAVLIAGLLSPYSYLFAGLAPMLWVLIVSILLYQRGRAEVTTEAA